MTQLLSDALRASACIIDFKCSALGLSRVDKKASRESEAAHGSKTGVGRVVVSRLAGVEDMHDAIMEQQRLAAALVKLNTMPWGLGGRRLMPNGRFIPWVTEYQKIYDAHEDLVEKFIDAAPGLLAEAQRNLGAYDVKPPTVDEIENAYAMVYQVEPMPDRASLGHATLDEGMNVWLQNQFEEQVKASHTTAMREALSRFIKPLGSIVTQMTAMEEASKAEAAGQTVKRPKIYDSLLGNVQDLASTFSSFNIMGDPFFADIAAKLSAFDQYKTEELKKAPTAQSAARQRAQELLDSVNNWLGPVRA